MSEDLVGTVLDGKFRVEAVIGKAHAGGMVYRGRNIVTGAPVVIRCPALPHDLDTGALDEALEEFLDEARMLANIGQATVDVERLVGSGVEITTYGRVPFCAFEWLAGRSLEKDIIGRTSSIGEAIAILEPAARALAAAHGMGAAHRDVRPANLWLAEADGRTRVKVAAWGLATRVGKGPTAFAAEYGAPEHFKSSYGVVGPATDVYGLALTLVEMMSGRRALVGADAGELYIATSDLAKRPTARARGAQVSDAVEAVLARALAVDPKRRYANVREMWEALLGAVPELTPAAPSVAPKATSESNLASRPPGIVTDARLGDVKVTSVPPKMPEPPPQHDRSAAWAWLAVAAVGVGAIAVVVAKVGRPATKKPPVATSASSSANPPASEPSVVVVKPFVTDMVRISAGTFTMGSDKDNKSDRPAHQVQITRAFYIDRTEVTAEAWAACIDDGVCAATKVHGGLEVVETAYGCNTKEKPNYPANCVDRAQAEVFCTWAGKRLPTEAEWEYAARGTDGREYPWGSTPPTSCKQAILTGMTGECGDRKGTFETGTTVDGKSPFGALDMAGNVWEWVADGYAEYPTAAVIDPRIAPAAKGILRGGSWDYATTSAKTTYRLSFPSNAGNVSTGFRCAKDD